MLKKIKDILFRKKSPNVIDAYFFFQLGSQIQYKSFCPRCGCSNFAIGKQNDEKVNLYGFDCLDCGKRYFGLYSVNDKQDEVGDGCIGDACF